MASVLNLVERAGLYSFYYHAIVIGIAIGTGLSAARTFSRCLSIGYLERCSATVRQAGITAINDTTLAGIILCTRRHSNKSGNSHCK